MIRYPENDLTNLFINQLKREEVLFDWITTDKEQVLYKGKIFLIKTMKFKIPWIVQSKIPESDFENMETYTYCVTIVKKAVIECNIKFAGGKIAINKVFGPNRIWEPSDEFCSCPRLMIRFARLEQPTENMILKAYKKYNIGVV